jgi:hypothetical protein
MPPILGIAQGQLHAAGHLSHGFDLAAADAAHRQSYVHLDVRPVEQICFRINLSSVIEMTLVGMYAETSPAGFNDRQRSERSSALFIAQLSRAPAAAVKVKHVSGIRFASADATTTVKFAIRRRML